MSTQRHCHIYLAANSKWYVEIGDFEHATAEDSTTYGPLADEAAAETEIDHHSNPGGWDVDSSGIKAAPAKPAKPLSGRS